MLTQGCMSCNESVFKAFLKYMPRPYGKDKRYKNAKTCRRSVFVDHTGRQWNGNQCPDCKYMRKL